MAQQDSAIKIIDCSEIQGKFGEIKETSYETVSKKLGIAMSDVGFAYLINHGVDLAKISKVNRLSKEFFTLPTSTKQKYCKPDPMKSFHGYAPPGNEVHDAVKNSAEYREAFDIFGLDASNPAKYPQEITGFKEAVDDLRPELNNMGKKLLKCFGKYLKLDDEDFFVKRHTNLDDPGVKCHTQFRALFYYPLNGNEDLAADAIRLGEHSDWGSITLLIQDMVGGLEIKTRNGEWIQATPIKDAIILNSGNLMELWTAGNMHAAVHRVTMPTKHTTEPRQSFIHFINPDGAEIIRPIVSTKPGNEECMSWSPVIAEEYTNAKYKALVNY